MANDRPGAEREGFPLVLELLPPHIGKLAIAGPALGFGILVGSMVWTIAEGLELEDGTQVWRLLLFLGIGAFLFGSRLLDRLAARKSKPTILFYSDHLVLPRLGSARSFDVKYEEISALYVVGRGSFERLFIDAKGSVMVFPRAAFRSMDGFVTMTGELWKRIQALPDGSERLLDFRRKSELLATTAGRPVVATKIFLFAIVAMYVLELVSGALDRVPPNMTSVELVSLGANARALIEQGQIFRFVTAIFLHDPVFGSHLHVILNSVALHSVGSLLEQLLGAPGIVLLFFVGGIAGNVASAFASNAAMSVGSSTAVAGLFGGLTFLAAKYRKSLPLVVRQTRSWWTVILGLNVAIPIAFPFVDGSGHLGGFLGGIVTCAVLVMGKKEPLAVIAPPTPSARAIAGAVAIACAAVGFVGVGRAWVGAEADEVVVLKAMTHDHDLSEVALNDIAYGVACDRTPSFAALQVAKEAAERAYAKSEGEPGIGDTVASVLFRMGDFERALAMQRDSFVKARLDPQVDPRYVAFYVSKIVRFGTVRADKIPNSATSTRTPTISVSKDRVRLELAEARVDDSVVYASVTAQDVLLGTLVVRIPAGTSGLIEVPTEIHVGQGDASVEALNARIILDEHGGPELDIPWGAGTRVLFYPYEPQAAEVPTSFIRPPA